MSERLRRVVLEEKFFPTAPENDVIVPDESKALAERWKSEYLYERAPRGRSGEIIGTQSVSIHRRVEDGACIGFSVAREMLYLLPD